MGDDQSSLDIVPSLEQRLLRMGVPSYQQICG